MSTAAADLRTVADMPKPVPKHRKPQGVKPKVAAKKPRKANSTPSKPRLNPVGASITDPRAVTRDGVRVRKPLRPLIP